MDPTSLIGLGTGLLGSLLGGGAANKAKAAAAAAQGQQNRLIGRQTDAYDQYGDVLQGLDREGYFDPAAQIQQLEADNDRTFGQQLAQLATALGTAGYRPGDSAIQNQLSAASQNNQAQLESQRFQMRQQAAANKLAAYAGYNAGSGSLNAGIGAYGQQVLNAQAQQQQSSAGMLGLIGAASQFLGTPKVAQAPAAPATKTDQNGLVDLLPKVSPNNSTGLSYADPVQTAVNSSVWGGGVKPQLDPFERAFNTK